MILRTDELQNAIDYLEKAAYYFSNRQGNHWFKWLMISLHGALYGFGVCTIRGTDPINRVFKDENVKVEKLERTKKYYLEQHGQVIDDDIALRVYKSQEVDLLGIWRVLDRCKNEIYMNQFTYSKILVLAENPTC